MNILNHLGQAAALLLLLELMVILIVFLAVAGGLAFGLRWVENKSDWAFGKVNGYLPLVTKYTRLGSDYVALPFIKVGGFVSTVKGTASAIERRIRTLRVASRPVPPPGRLEPDDPTEEQSIEPVAIV